MKLIKDIRLFESDVPNIDGNSIPGSIGKLYLYDDMACLDVIQRLLFLLRYLGFGFDGFDHLYVNFTPCIPHGDVQDVNRYNIREFSWYHYVDAGCDLERFNSWTPDDRNTFVLDSIRKAAVLKAPAGQRPLLEDAFEEVLKKGEHLFLPYKRKENDTLIVEVFTRINAEPDFLPLIRITGKDGTVKAEQELRAYGRDEFISQIGTITISKHSVRISPRKNWYADFYDLKPIKIIW